MKNHHLAQHTWQISLLFLTILLIGCQSVEDHTVSAEQPTAETSPQPTVSAQADYWTAWQSSPHAQTYALEKGPNTYCARCHSPQNWDMAAKVDRPPNCVSCKFPNEPEPRIAQSNSLVPEEEWQDIGCAVCHRMENGAADAEVVWLDVRTNYYETVTSTTELCEKCHADTETLRHGRDVSGGAHADFACTDCHDAHTVAASCTTSGCHADFTDRYPEIIVEHQDQVNDKECTDCHPSVADIHMNALEEMPVVCMDCHEYLMGEHAQVRYQAAHSNLHATVTCVACHDGAALEVGPAPGQEQWVTFRTTSLLGRETTAPYQSHNVQLAVDCVHCHYPDNPWELMVDIEELPDAASAE